MFCALRVNRPGCCMTAFMLAYAITVMSMSPQHEAASSVKKHYYISPGTFDTLSFPPPPDSGSAAWKADSDTIVFWQNKRAVADCERADSSFFVAFESFWGDKCPFSQPLPQEVKDFFDRVDSDVKLAVNTLKFRFGRPRPEITNPCPGKNAARGKKGSYSYPSFHAAISRVFADVLTDMVLGRQAEFMAKADEIARDRVIIGVHFPSDVSAGKEFGDRFHVMLLESDLFLKDFATVKGLLLK